MAKFKVGDRVYFHGRPATIKQVIREPDADYILDVQGNEFYAEDEEITTTNSAPCRSTNAVVQNALNARTARNAGEDTDMRDAKYVIKVEIPKLIKESDALNERMNSMIQQIYSLERSIKALPQNEETKNILLNLDSNAKFLSRRIW